MGFGSRTLVRLAALLRRNRPAPSLAYPLSTAAAVNPRSAARTDVGRVRSVNEDRVLDAPDRALWAVADGMGGLSAGDVAAQTAVTMLAAIEAVSEASLLDALQRANAAILAQGGGRSGATIVAAHAHAGVATVLWAGDSRAYQVRGTTVRRLTRDHSVVQDLIDAGLLDEAQAEGHPRANVVTRALGVTTPVTIDTMRVAVAPGDRILLCSDGVSRSLDLRDLGRGGALDALADRLLGAALERDGSDNASLVLIDF
jgi:serine/threonine protein phosphatase PrpC